MSWSSDEMMRAVEDALRPRILDAKGDLSIATDPDHALSLLLEAPTNFRVILGWPGYGEHPEAIYGVTTQKIFLIVQIGEGLSINPGSELHRGRASLPTPFMGLVEKLSMWVRAMRFPDGSGFDAKGFAQGGSAWLEVDGVTTRQHQIDFSVQAALPAEETVIPLSLTKS